MAGSGGGAVKGNPKTTTAGIGAAIVAAISSISLALGYEIDPKYLTALVAVLGTIQTLMGLFGKDGDK